MGKSNISGGGGGLNQSLSNLIAPTAANESILPAGTAQTLGDDQKPWEEVTARLVNAPDTLAGTGEDLNVSAGLGPSGLGKVTLIADQLDLSGVSTILFGGQTVNAISDLFAMELRLNLNYSNLSIPAEAVDGFFILPFQSRIEKVYMYNVKGGTGGATTLDVKRATASGGTFTSIFNTLPSIQAAAGDSAYTGTGLTTPSTTAPVVNPSFEILPADTALRLDLIAKQSGAPEGSGIIIFFRKV